MGLFNRVGVAYDSLRQMAAGIESLFYIAGDSYRLAALRAHPHGTDPRYLVPYGYKVYSQGDEDGILVEIFRRIGTTDRRFVEFGVGPGTENNTVALLLDGWSGTWIEAREKSVARIREGFAPLIGSGRLGLTQAFILAENIGELFRQNKVPAEFDLLSIDIDGNDYWVWKALDGYRPRVVVIEYNSSLGPRIEAKRRYDPKWAAKGSRRAHGASLKALELLGKAKGYLLVGCGFRGGNAFFVREDLVGDAFLAPYTSEQHFEPPRHYMRFFTARRLSYQDIPYFFEKEQS